MRYISLSVGTFSCASWAPRPAGPPYGPIGQDAEVIWTPTHCLMPLGAAAGQCDLSQHEVATVTAHTKPLHTKAVVTHF